MIKLVLIIMEEERIFSVSGGFEMGMEVEEENDRFSLGDSVFGGSNEGSKGDFEVLLACNEGTNTTAPPLDPNPTHSAEQNTPNAALIKATSPQVLARLLETVRRVAIPPLGGYMSTFAQGLVKNRKRAHELHKVLADSGVYLPDMRCKRVTYGFLLGIVEGRFISVRREGVINSPCQLIVKAPSRVLIYEINKIAKLQGKSSGYHLSRAFPRDYYIQVLYKLDEKNSVFPQCTPLLTADQQAQVDIDEAVNVLVEEVPMPETFRGLIRFNRERLKTSFYGSLFGGELGVQKLQGELASASYNIGRLGRVLRALKKNISRLGGVIELEEHMEVAMTLLAP